MPGLDYIEYSYKLLGPHHITNSYGLFRRMTGVGGRPELVILGSMDGKKWEEYILPYKPQNVTVGPKFNIPHQPRLDWQMWFAALSNINQSHWFFMMLNRLFYGSESVLSLFEYVPYKKPKYIKVELYLYYFTRSGNNWWTRKYVKDWIPSISPESYLIEQWEKLGYPNPKKAKSRGIHPFHFVPVVKISIAALLIKAFSTIFIK
jgi:Lipase maturation factor